MMNRARSSIGAKPPPESRRKIAFKGYNQTRSRRLFMIFDSNILSAFACIALVFWLYGLLRIHRSMIPGSKINLKPYKPPLKFPKHSAIVIDRQSSTFKLGLPCGNGRLGAMVYGSPHHAVININDEQIYGGGTFKPLSGVENLRQKLNQQYLSAREYLKQMDYQRAQEGKELCYVSNIYDES